MRITAGTITVRNRLEVDCADLTKTALAIV
jgi:hypothetical protein